MTTASRATEITRAPYASIATLGQETPCTDDTHSAVKTAVACQRAGMDHIVGLRVRVVPERGYRTWGERVGELILLAMDEAGWLSLVGLTNRGFLGGADRGKPRVDWRDLETYSEGV